VTLAPATLLRDLPVVLVPGLQRQFALGGAVIPQRHMPARVAVLDHLPVSQPRRQPIHEPVEHCHAS
jgi:hypothetical protein